MNELLQDPMFFYAVAFVIFLALAFIYGRKPGLAWIDGEIAKIRTELEAAYQLRAEAEATLAACKAKQAQAESEAQMILSMAKEEVENLRKTSAQDLAAALTRHEQMAAERIRMAEADAVKDVRDAAITAALSIARKTLLENLTEADANRLIDEAIADIPAMKPTKAKAA